MEENKRENINLSQVNQNDKNLGSSDRPLSGINYSQDSEFSK